MFRETNYTGIILKKQPLNEGDEIVTFFTLEAGKVRGLAKSSKLAKSKLQHGLQTLFLVNFKTAGSTLPKIIGVEVVNSFGNLRENFEAVKVSYYASELMLKFTPDQQNNEPLFHLGKNFFEFLDKNQTKENLELGLAKFKMEFLETLGLAIHYKTEFFQSSQIHFSNSLGGFMFDKQEINAMPVSRQSLEMFNALNKASFGNLPIAGEFGLSVTQELQHLLSGFISYQLERDIKSEKYLNL